MFSKRSLFLLAVLIILFTALSIHAGLTPDPTKTSTARRTTTAIRIDGALNEQDWQTALSTNGFRQEDPYEGETAVDSTVVKVLYDDNAVYFGFWCYDNEPDKIERILTRRDRWSESDAVTVRIDSHHDHQTAYLFYLNSAGVLRDGMIFNNINEDFAWDAVWDANISLTDWGWTAEYKIPYSALRFGLDESYTWGVNFTRYVPRRHELSIWQFVPSSQQRGVISYGHLSGLDGIKPPGRIEMLPYTVAYDIKEPKSAGNPDGNELMSNVGVDFKYGLSSAFTLDAAINPDFGQVESDRSVINLSTFETYYEEKRPFFLEGSEIFSNLFIRQFYSRRIGRPPYGDVDSLQYYINYPRNTSILGAFKLSGKTDGGTSIGIMNATTQEEKAKFMNINDAVSEAVVEPLANYTVARVRQDIFTNSYIGGMLTSTLQKERQNSYCGSADWTIYLPGGKYQWDGNIIYTNNGPGTGGYGVVLGMLKASGKNFLGSIAYSYFDKKVDWNRLGFLNENEKFEASIWLHFRSNKEFSIIRYLRLDMNGNYSEYLEGYKSTNYINARSSIGFTNNWWLNADINFWGSAYNKWETRGNGWWKMPNWYYFGVDGTTNQTKPIYVSGRYEHGNFRNSLYHEYSADIFTRPASNFELSLENAYRIYRDAEYWIGVGVSDRLPIFGEHDFDELDITLRGTYTFSRNLTVQLYSQFYIYGATYSDYKRLISEDQLSPIEDENYLINFARSDLNYKSLNLNLVLRWEYRPGSTIYLVWTQARTGTDPGDTEYYTAFDFSRDFGGIFDLPQTNTFLIKANYWWNI